MINPCTRFVIPSSKEKATTATIKVEPVIKDADNSLNKSNLDPIRKIAIITIPACIIDLRNVKCIFLLLLMFENIFFVIFIRIKDKNAIITHSKYLFIKTPPS